MVISTCRIHKTSEYSLDVVRYSSKNKQLFYKSRRVQQDVENLGFSLGIVCQCLQSLDERHYHESVNYDDKQGWFNV